MKNILITILTFLSLILNGQNNMKEQLNKLFLDLDLTLNLHNMVAKSSLKFEYGINRGISWGSTSNNTNTYIAKFYKNQLIDSEIKSGQITITQTDEEVLSGYFSVNERIWFHNLEDMMKEYYKICSSFEKLGYRVKNTIIENENFEIKNEFTEILIGTDSRRSKKLTISYSIPPKEEKNKEFFLAFIYTNHYE